MEFIVRAYREEDLPQIAHLFYDTVHAVNSKDYTQKQVDAWAPRDKTSDSWKDSFDGRFVFVAELRGMLEGTIVGYGMMHVDGLLEHLYTHKDYLKKGIASAILAKMVDIAQKLDLKEIQVEASLTSKPFFVKRGFKNITLQKKRHRNLLYLNYFMHRVL